MHSTALVSYANQATTTRNKGRKTGARNRACTITQTTPPLLWQAAALEPRLRMVAPGINGSRIVLAATWTTDMAGVQAVLPGGGQLPAGEYIVQVTELLLTVQTDSVTVCKSPSGCWK